MARLRRFVQLVLVTGAVLQAAAKVEAKKPETLPDAVRDEVEDIFLEQWTERSYELRQIIQAEFEKSIELDGACLMQNSNTFYDPIISDCRHCSTCRDSTCYSKCYSYELEKRLDRQESSQMTWSMINSILLIVAVVIIVLFGVYCFLKLRRVENLLEQNKVQCPTTDSDDSISQILIRQPTQV